MNCYTLLAEFIESNRSGSAFGFSGKELTKYLEWAAAFNYLFLEKNESAIKGVGVAFPVNEKFNGTDEWFFSFKNPVHKSSEADKDICIMDILALDPLSRSSLVFQFCSRFPNWKFQEKWALRQGKPRKISNKTITFLKNYGLK